MHNTARSASLPNLGLMLFSVHTDGNQV